MRKNRVFRESFTLLMLVILLLVSNIVIKSKNSETKIKNEISQSINQILEKHDSLSADFKINYKNRIYDPVNFYSQKKIEETAIYIFENDSLIYWSSDINSPTSLLAEAKSSPYLYHQGNNEFLITLTEFDNLKFYTSTPLYYHNPHFENENKFLPKKINGIYKINFNVSNDKLGFTIDYQAKMNKIDSYILGALLTIILVISFRLTYLILEIKRKNKNNAILFILISILIFVALDLLQNTLFISTSELFGESCLLDGCRYSFSLGRLAEFSILLFSIITVISSGQEKEIKANKALKLISSSLILIATLLIYTYLIYNLISNINIPFSFLQIYDTTAESYFVLIIICILTCSIIILTKYLMKILITKDQSYILSLACLSALSICIELLINQGDGFRYSIFTNIVAIIFYSIVIWEKKSKLKIKRIVRDLSIITLMTAQLTYILYFSNETKEREEMEWFATIIGDESDKSFEDVILKITEEIKKDKNLIKWQQKNEFPSDDSILNYFNENYFNTEIISDYNKVVTLCDTNTILIVEDVNDYEVRCNSLFEEILDKNYTSKISEELTLVDDPTTDSYYILKLKLSPNSEISGNICYIEFYKEYILNYIGIPEIITSYQNVIMPNLVDYSFSCYENNILQYKYGFYNYPNELSNFRYKNEEYVKTKIFKHLSKTFDERKTIIVTIEKPRLIEIIAPFSYIFIVLTLMYYLNHIYFKRREKNQIRRSFHSKMQLAIILTLGFSFMVAGFTSFIFIKNSIKKKTNEFQYEKNKIIVKNLEHDIIINKVIDDEHLKKYKENYFSDINIYDLNGKLTNSTQPKLFNGYKSEIINRKAYESIKLRHRFYYSHEEEIDGTRYNSSYYPLKDQDGNTYAIVNIPYFDNKTSNKSSVSNFIITYLNIILVLMGLSALVVILMTRRTIKPLEMIQDKMQKINLGGKNEEIEWKSKDEIGELINIYNKLIKELEISANNLMRSERETAWREMARQVAHEIKNPLTPMKLNIQFLQMAWDEKNPDIDRKLRETTKSILEQIEILSNIASAFSDYAKLPKKNIETLNIKELILSTINLYDNNKNIKIEFIEENHSDYIINSDKNNLSIVFGNIIKNAIQAIGRKEDGLIKINISDLHDRFLIKINDNGCGIAEEEKKKIFMPNFTTKSSGMGVGLSIVYDILETLNGSINFESESGNGTTFFIEIRKG